MTKKFANTRYEYITCEFPTEPATMTPAFEAELERDGWHRAWADITMEGTFVVYRRERKAMGCDYHGPEPCELRLERTEGQLREAAARIEELEKERDNWKSYAEHTDAALVSMAVERDALRADLVDLVATLVPVRQCLEWWAASRHGQKYINDHGEQDPNGTHAALAILRRLAAREKEGKT